ncbi:MAG: hypothetical protein MUC36_08645 [Planctomycetes bacterium]|jgi:hypothetical protein|nr:hypothetical protein [Planctomycetota bacterium]
MSKTPRPAAPAALPRLVVAIAVAAGTLALSIHGMVFRGELHVWLRDWALHFAAVLFAAILTSALLGYHRQRDDRATWTMLQLGCLVPFVLLGLHELGQWLWPAGPRDHFDSVRDTLLNAFGTAAAWLLLWRTRPRRRPAE